MPITLEDCQLPEHIEIAGRRGIKLNVKSDEEPIFLDVGLDNAVARTLELMKRRTKRENLVRAIEQEELDFEQRCTIELKIFIEEGSDLKRELWLFDFKNERDGYSVQQVMDASCNLM